MKLNYRDFIWLDWQIITVFLMFQHTCKRQQSLFHYVTSTIMLNKFWKVPRVPWLSRTPPNLNQVFWFAMLPHTEITWL